MWCGQSWTPRQEETRPLTSAQRPMLRRIICARRAPEEDYITWLRRSTEKAVALAKRYNVREWVETHALYKWSWAGHAIRRPQNTWVWRTTTWRDADWQTLVTEEMGASRPMRPSRRRWMKWEDALRRFCSYEGIRSWTELATNRGTWAGKAAEFAKWFANTKTAGH